MTSKCAVLFVFNFYRAMHYSAKRGTEAASRLSVCPSVCDVGRSENHIGWKSWKLIPRTISLTTSLFVTQRPHLSPRGLWRLDPPGLFGQLSLRQQESLVNAKVSARHPLYIGRNSLNRPPLRIAQQYQHNLYIVEKYFQCATIPSLTMRRLIG